MSSRLMGPTLLLRLSTGELMSMMTTSEEAEDEVGELVDVCDYHYDGEDLPKLPRIIDSNYTGPNVGPI
jgi:hypothetical protein